jgi:hypothetical protein
MMTSFHLSKPGTLDSTLDPIRRIKEGGEETFHCRKWAYFHLKEKDLPLFLHIRGPLLKEMVNPTLQTRKNLEGNPDNLGENDLPCHIARFVFPLGISPVLAPNFPIISMANPDTLGSGLI